jgi:hypothetical protein
MRYRYAISYESESQPVETVRGEFEAGGFDSALRQGSSETCTHWPHRRVFRSVVIVVERIEEPLVAVTHKLGPPRAVSSSFSY